MSIHLIMGPMYSGKTTELLRRLDRYKYTSKRVTLIKWIKDTRYGGETTCETHYGTQRMGAICCASDALMDLIPHLVSISDVVGVDEGQFFSSLSKFSMALAMMGKIVVISSLDGDWRHEPFGEISKLIPCCDEVIKLTSICSTEKCGQDGIFTGKKASYGNSDKIIEVGGSDIYVTLCRKCYEERARDGLICH